VYQELEQLFSAADIPILYMAAGDRLEGEDYAFKCLWPERGVLSDDRNDLSLVMLAEYGDFHMLLTGDISAETESRLAASGRLSEVEILKTPHHGSKYSSSEIFLDQLRPTVSLISCSATNRYGHPGKETLERMNEVGSRVMITRDCGAIRVWTDGRRVEVSGYVQSR
jgi:competence protein ComEC